MRPFVWEQDPEKKKQAFQKVSLSHPLRMNELFRLQNVTVASRGGDSARQED